MTQHRTITGRVVIATHNPGKLREMTELLAPYGIETVSAGMLHLPEPEETGTTFAENARIKAEAATKASGLPAFADDSGIAVAALDGAPGIHSARWGGRHKDFQLAMDMVESKVRVSQSINTRTRGDSWRLRGYSSDTGLGVGGNAGNTATSVPALSSSSTR